MIEFIACARGLVLIALVASLAAPASTTPHAQRVNPNAKAIAGFQEEVQAYVELHRKLERTLSQLPTDATPTMIDQHQRALERLVQQARKGAKVGDIFTRDVRPVFRRLLYGTFTGPDGKRLRNSIMEENPGPAVKLQVNGRYPDTVPLSSVPPQVLKALPALPEELEYRFIEDQLILLDAHAHIIVDYLSGAIPR